LTQTTAIPSRANRLNPSTWLVWTVCAACAALVMRNPWYLLALGAVALFVGRRWTGEAPGRGTVYLVLSIVVSSTLINLLFSRAGETVLLEWPILSGFPSAIPSGMRSAMLSAIRWIGGPYTLEAMLFGLSAGVQVATLLLVMGVFTRVLTAADLLRRTPRGLYPIGVASTLALSFAPHARRAFFDLREAREIRGQSDFHWREAPRLLTPLVVVALERAVAQAEALAARGWASEAPMGNHRWEGALAWMAIGAAVLLCAASPERVLLALALLIVAATVHWLALRRREKITRYRSEPWRERDTFIALLAVSSAIALTVLATKDLGSLAYYPYPLAYLPALEPGPMLAVACLAAPAVIPSTGLGARSAEVPSAALRS